MRNFFYSSGLLFVIVNDAVIMNRSGHMERQGILFQRINQAIQPPPLNDEERMHAVAVSILSCPGGNSVWGMLDSCMPREIYRRVSAAGQPAVQRYIAEFYPLSPLAAARKIIDKAGRQSIRILTWWDSDYPALLREIQWPPLVLYVKGSLPSGCAVAVVGTRKSDSRSSAVARRIGGDLAARGYAVVSGMAVGIDREAHLGALDNAGATVGVLANGIDIAYPLPNRDLYRRIEAAAGSALISEYPPGIYAGKWTFVRRNRIISGLCVGTVVVKAGGRSGALITARHSLEQNREVFACAGNSFDDEYAGCHRLIRNGAVLVSRTDDIIAELSRFVVARPLPAGDDDSRVRAPVRSCGFDHDPDTLPGRILQMLSMRGYDLDALVRAVAASPGEVNEAVVELELEGRILRNGNTLSRL
ncbi:MAG: DNA protecting protein DprA [Spirochaetes bacterium RBG_13_51_14]|nr:MAG: DNA protecting protein DprA [Spirochaetes bacterium RBG_13_51_14]